MEIQIQKKMKQELKKKVESAVNLLQLIEPKDGSPVEVAYSGGKDSDVILELTRMAGIKYRAIYKCTTIDPPGTIRHAIEKGAEIIRPKMTFFQLVEKKGYPSRIRRFCCDYLKEYKILDKVIMGVRKAESVARRKRYNEPTACKNYGSKKEHVEAIYPILTWSDNDVVDFVVERGIVLHPLYYREDGTIDPKRRLGCMGCPLKSKKGRIRELSKYPNLVKAYIRAGQKFLDTHPQSKTCILYENAYDYFVRNLFYDSQDEWVLSRTGFFEPQSSKQFLEDYFKITL